MPNYKTIFENLPKNWDELPLGDFLKLTKIQIEESGDFAGVDNTLSVLSVLTKLSVDELGELPATVIKSYAEKISFTTEIPKPNKKSVIEWKKIDEISYDAFITYQTFAKNPFDHLATIIKSFSTTELTEEEILQLSTQEVLNGFFLLRKEMRKYFTGTIRYLKVKLLMQIMKKKAQHIKQTFQKLKI